MGPESLGEVALPVPQARAQRWLRNLCAEAGRDLGKPRARLTRWRPKGFPLARTAPASRWRMAAFSPHFAKEAGAKVEKNSELPTTTPRQRSFSRFARLPPKTCMVRVPATTS